MFLRDQSYQDKLYELLKFYDSELQDLIDMATIECDGIRPVNVENEIYSVFHHICRSALHKKDAAEACKELETAVSSHLVRVQFDAYKIVLNRTLLRAVAAIKDYDFLLLDDDFRTAFPKEAGLIQDLRLKYKTVKDAYIEAKKRERDGDRTKTVEKYNEAVKEVPAARAIIDGFESDGAFRVALLSAKKKIEGEKKTRRYVVAGAIISSVSGLIGAVLGAWFSR